MNENEFRLYLNTIINKRGNKFKNSKINEFISDLKIKIPKKMKQEINLLDITSIEKLSDIKEKLTKGDLSNFNKSEGNGRPSSAIYQYINFLSEIKKENKLIEKFINTKNIILYGSPGVGKTHNTNKLINLIESGMSEKEIFENIQANEATEYEKIDFKERVKFVTFHQSFGYEDFIEGFRPNEDGKIELVDGVFKALCEDAQKNLDDSKKNINILQSEYNLKNSLNNFIEEYIKKEEKIYLTNSVFLSKIDNNSFYYSSDSGAVINARIPLNDLLLCTLNKIQNLNEIKSIKELSGTSKQRPTYLFKLYELFNQFNKEYSDNITIEKIERKNYYLIIDEINRGNISKIFGELITLIEEDKRDKLEVTLPYSKQSFKIPSNLYIIGTMNSTDKSIALIDIALRRRFTFLKMNPNAELIIYPKAKAIFLELNNKIIEKLGEDYQIGHSYFMNIADEEDLRFVLDYKIEPLLEEYFYGDDDGLKEMREIIKI